MKNISQLNITIKEACTVSAASLFIIPIIFFPFLYYSFNQGKELSFKLIILLGVSFLFLYCLKKKTLRIRAIGNSLFFILLLGQLFIHAISNFFSSTPLVALYGTFSRGEGFIFELFLFTFLMWNALFLSKDNIKKVLQWFWIGSVIVATYAIIQKFGIEIFFQDYSTNMFQGRVFSFLGNPSLLGQLMALSSISGVYLMLQKNTYNKKLLFGGGTILILSTVFLSGTRSAVLALIVISLLTIFKYHRNIFFNLKKIKIWHIILLPIIALIIWGGSNDRFNFSGLSLRSLHSRFEIWEGTTSLIQQKWILGHGQETFYLYFPEIVTKNFLTLEESVNISADHVHNEFLEEVYSHGIFAGIIYLMLFGLLLKKFITSKNDLEVTISGLLLTNIFQNQLSFPDASIFVVIAFAWGALVAMESKEISITNTLLNKKNTKWLAILGLTFFCFLGFQTIIRPFMGHYYYSIFHNNFDNYDKAITGLKKSLTWTPYYSEIWYDLMFVDKSSMDTAIRNLEIIVGDSGDLLAWKGNYYAESNPQLSAEFFILALEKNPTHPNWLRAFGDMLYSNNDCETALYIYNQYIEAVPEYWKWSTEIESYSEIEQKSYETFFKHAPYFFGTLEKMETCRTKIDGDSPAE